MEILSLKRNKPTKRQKARKRRIRQKQLFAKYYNKTKKYEFPAKDKISMDKHIYLPKLGGTWGFGRDKQFAALAVYPVLCSRADFKKDKWFQLPLEAIAKMAGISEPTASKGTKQLRKYSLSNNKQLLKRKKSC